MWSAAHIDLPQVSGFREIARPTFSSEHQLTPSSTTGRMMDSSGFMFARLIRNFERRLVLVTSCCTRPGPTTTFRWVQKSSVTSTDDVVRLLPYSIGMPMGGD